MPLVWRRPAGVVQALAVGVVIGAEQQAGGGELLADVAGDGGQVASQRR